MGSRHPPLDACVLVVGLLVGCGSESSFIGEDEEIREPVEVEETFVQEPRAQVDVLWVIDDTSSMADEQDALAGAFGAFAAALGELGLAWQIGVVTTDVSGAEAGRLRGDPWILTPDLADPVAEIQAAAAVGTEGAPPEAGLGAAFLALTEPLRSTDNRAFRREGAALHVVVVSDADDDSAGLLGEDPAGAFTTFLEEEAERSGADARLSAVVGDVPAGCSWEGGAALPGASYAAVAEATGGALASICAQDLSAVAEALGERSASWPSRFALQAEPDPASVRVWVDDERLSEGFGVETDPPALSFEIAPEPGAEIRVRYEVAE